MTRLASFNVENLFERAKLLSAEANKPLEAVKTVSGMLWDAFADFNQIIAKSIYLETDKADLLRLASTLGLLTEDESNFFILRSNRGRLLDRRNGTIRVAAHGRADWLGWLELKSEAVNEVSTQNTARVIQAVNADILVVVEAEHRNSLNRFNKAVLSPVTGLRYEHVMLIDGNDERGIDVGVMSKRDYPIESMRSHVDEMRDGGMPLFSRDCPEYYFTLPSCATLLVLPNHLKSKRTNSPADAAAATTLRTLQARRVRQLYEQRLSEGFEFIAIVGDLNDSPGSEPIEELTGLGSTLTDIGAMPLYVSGNFHGTYGQCTPQDKIDYILCSPALTKRVTAAGVNRSGLWAGKDGPPWPVMSKLTQQSEAASDHAAIFVDFDL